MIRRYMTGCRSESTVLHSCTLPSCTHYLVYCTVPYNIISHRTTAPSFSIPYYCIVLYRTVLLHHTLPWRRTVPYYNVFYRTVQPYRATLYLRTSTLILLYSSISCYTAPLYRIIPYFTASSYCTILLYRTLPVSSLNAATKNWFQNGVPSAL